MHITPKKHLKKPGVEVDINFGIALLMTVRQLHFCEKAVKINALNYQTDILENRLKPLKNTLFAG